MNDLFCRTGNLGSLGSWGIWGWSGLVLHPVFWVGMFAGPTLLAWLALRHTRFPADNVSDAIGGTTSKEILQAQFARG